MAVLHEVLAVEGDLRKTATNIREEATSVFRGKPQLFTETSTSTQYFDDEEGQRLNSVETEAITTTVSQKLDWVGENLTRYYDAYLQKEATNQTARADIVLDGVVFLSDVPVTALLGFEQLLKELRDTYLAIPTLRPGPIWTKDADKGKGVYRAKEPEVAFITKKTIRPVVLVPATDKHPAQIEKVPEDVKIAKRSKAVWSGNLSSGEKADLVDRLDRLIQAFKQARQRANNAEVVNKVIGKKIFDYLHGPVLSS